MATDVRLKSDSTSQEDLIDPRPAAAPPPRRRRTVPDKVLSAALAVVLIALAEVAARNDLVSDLILPAPSEVLAALTDGFASGLYWEHITSTLVATLVGFAVAAVSAILVAGALTSIPILERVLLPFIFAFQTLPKIAVAPLVVLWLGFGQEGKVFIVIIVCFFPILVPTLQGLRIRERDQLELMRSLGSTRWQLFRYLRMRNAVPYIFAGLQIGVIFSLIGAVTAEFVGSRAGLGYVLLQNKAQFNVPGVFAILLLLMVIGLTFHALVRAAEKRIAFWSEDISTTAV